MSRDPIIDEVRAIRDDIAREHNYDLDAIFLMLRTREMRSGRSHVTFPPRRFSVTTAPEAEDAAQSAAADVASRRG